MVHSVNLKQYTKKGLFSRFMYTKNHCFVLKIVFIRYQFNKWGGCGRDFVFRDISMIFGMRD